MTTLRVRVVVYLREAEMSSTNLLEPVEENLVGESQESANPPNSRLQQIIIATCLFVLSSSLLWVAGSTYAAGLRSLGYTNVNGKINEIVVNRTPFGRDQIATTRYVVNGKVLQSKAPLPKDRLIKEGETVDVYFDQSNPSAISFTREVDYDTVIICGSIGFFALSFGSFMAYKLRNAKA